MADSAQPAVDAKHQELLDAAQRGDLETVKRLLGDPEVDPNFVHPSSG